MRFLTDVRFISLSGILFIYISPPVGLFCCSSLCIFVNVPVDNISLPRHDVQSNKLSVSVKFIPLNVKFCRFLEII